VNSYVVDTYVSVRLMLSTSVFQLHSYTIIILGLLLFNIRTVNPYYLLTPPKFYIVASDPQDILPTLLDSATL